MKLKNFAGFKQIFDKKNLSTILTGAKGCLTTAFYVYGNNHEAKVMVRVGTAII